MERDCMIKVENVSIKFNLASERVDNFKEYVIKTIKGQIAYDEFWALSDAVSYTHLDVYKRQI